MVVAAVVSEGGQPWSSKDICESFGREGEEGLRNFWKGKGTSLIR